MFKKSSAAMAAATLVLGLVACTERRTNLADIADATLFASDGVNLTVFNSRSRLRSSSITAISGLAAGTTVIGLDVNPNGGALVALGSNGQTYNLNSGTGVATAVGAADTTTSFANKVVDIDFNPRAQNVFRVVTSTLDNHRRRATDGTRAGTDTAFSYITGDVNAGKTLTTTAAAYTDSKLNGGTPPKSTIVYVIDVKNDVLACLGTAQDATTTPPTPSPLPSCNRNPNAGQLNTIGKLGVDLEGNTPFDIDSAGNGFVAARFQDDWHLFSVNLSTGALADAGLIPPGVGNLVTLAVQQR